MVVRAVSENSSMSGWPNKPVLIVVCGPTASGKTSTSLQLAKKLSCPILSFDSRQFYREMNIGTAKPSPEDLAAAEHHFINCRSVSDPVYTAGIFETDALLCLNAIFEKNRCCIAVGGSGLYIDALCYGIDDIPKDEKIRNQLNAQVATGGLAILQQRLAEIDPEYYATTDIRNPRRIVRGLEVFHITGKKLSELRVNQKKIRPFNVVWIGLNPEREALFGRINQRVEEMIQTGLESETKNLLEFRSSKALQTLGYREMFDFLDEKTDLVETVRLIQRNSRIYAKKQLTWFRRNTEIQWFDPEAGNSGIIEYVHKKVGEMV